MSEQTWQERYASRVSSVEQAIKAIPRGRRILIGSGRRRARARWWRA